MKWFNFIRFGIETAIRFVIFVLPVSWVAKWADLTPSWKLAVFLAFLAVWSDIVLGKKDQPAGQADQPAAERPKRTVALLTRAEVVSEARKQMHTPRHDNSNWI